MKSLFKTTLVSGAVAIALVSQCAFAVEQPVANTAPATSTTQAQTTSTSQIEVESYALGVSFSQYISDMLSAQNSTNDINKTAIIAGFSDALNNKSKLSKEEVSKEMDNFQQRMMEKEKAHLEQLSAASIKEGNAFVAKFEKEKGVKKTNSGLLYKIEKTGNTHYPKPTDHVEVKYSGKLVNGQEFDNSNNSPTPVIFPLNGVIAGWTEGLQLIGEGGKVKLVIPPNLAYGDRNIPSSADRIGIPPQSTLVFDVELVKIHNDTAKDAKTK